MDPLRLAKGISVTTSLFVVLVSLAGVVRASGVTAAGNFLPPHSDSGVDLDGDSLYNVLRLEIKVESVTLESFALVAELRDGTNSTFIAYQYAEFNLHGTTTIALDLAGPSIHGSGFDGPYQANLFLYTVDLEGAGTLTDYNEHVTAAYLHTEFDQIPVTFAPPHSDTGVDTDADTLFDFLEVGTRINVTEPGTYRVDGVLFDRLDRPIDSASTTTTLSRGVFTVPVDFAGWTIYASGQDGPFNVSLSWGQPPWPPLDFNSHTTATYAHTDFETPPAALSPPHSDEGVDSDGDGLFNAIAVDVSVSVSQSGTYSVSGRLLHPVPDEPDLGVDSVTETLSAGPHTIRLEFSTLYICCDGPYVARLALTTEMGDFVSGSHTTAPYRASGFDRPPDTAAPTIADATASPDPAEAGQPILFSAGVTDDVGVRSVSVQVSDHGIPLGKFTMPFNSQTGRFEVSRSFARIATLSFKVWASDQSGNYASTTGSVVLRDTTAPALTATTDSPDPVELGGTITISSQIGDLFGIGSAKVEIEDPTGVVLGNFAMSPGSGTTYSYQFSPSLVGTYTYQIVAADPSGNARVASGAFQVRDTTPPLADAGLDRSVNQGTTVTFDGAGSSDYDGIASYAWTLNDNGAVSLSGPSPTYRFDRAGTFTVTLTVTDASGNSDSDTVVIIVAATTGAIPSGLGIELWGLLIAVIVAVVVALLVLMHRKARPPTT